MKKSFFAVMATLVLVTTSAMASISGTLLPPVPDSISWDHASLQTNTSGYSGTYSHYYMWRVTGDTSWSFGPTTFYATSPVKKSLDFLPANISIEVKSVLVDGSFVFTSNTITFTTKPLPRPAWLSSPAIISAPISTRISFNYDVRVPTKVFGYYAGYSNSSDTVTVNGTGSSFVTITSPNVPGTTYSANKLYAYAVGGEVVDTFISISDFTVPSWVSPDVVSVAIGVVTQDSFTFTTTLTKGNDESALVVFTDLDSSGTIVTVHPTIRIYHDTALTRTRLDIPNARDGEMISITSAGGTDAMFFYERLLQVPAPEILSADTVNATTTSTDLTIRVKTNGRSYWPTSSADVWLKWADKNGNIFTTAPQSTAGSTATVTLTVTGLSNLKLNPTTNSATIYIQNIAGLIDSQVITFVVKPPHAAVPISTGWYLEAWSSFELRTWSINAGPATDPYDLYAFVNAVGSGAVDTILLRPGQTGYTNFFQKDTIGGRVGNTLYDVRLATKNIDGVWFITGSQQQLTIPPAQPTFFISNAYTTTYTSLTFKVSGCGNGTRSYLDVHVYPVSSPGSAVYSTAFGYQGTGNFSTSGVISGLDPCTEYTIKAEVHNGSHGDALLEERTAVTKCVDTFATSIDVIDEISITLFPNPATDQVTIKGDQSLGQVTIISMEGKVVFSKFVSQNEVTIKITDLEEGMYIIRADSFIGKFLKNKTFFI